MGAKITAIWMVILMIVISVISLVIGYHMSLQGGLTKRTNVKPFYIELAEILSELK
ncbi:hypothetical protein [Butyrivibrio sp.]|uniref:hypothetical protein n=1 Tax=Butyrivibrio sp. TaxID=28121 RepID=UPI0025C5232A|nr:hypothetical protein [Butyrivibrio sp.]MBQ9303782.1 hypothetical protein [Butyrivibrio sp.]